MRVVRLQMDDVLIERLSDLTVAELRAMPQDRVFIGTELGYEFEMYLGREDIFLVRDLQGTPDEGSVYEGHLWVDSAQKMLQVGMVFNISGMEEHHLRVSRFVVAYIEVRDGLRVN